jgi:hypothetical protein
MRVQHREPASAAVGPHEEQSRRERQGRWHPARAWGRAYNRAVRTRDRAASLHCRRSKGARPSGRRRRSAQSAVSASEASGPAPDPGRTRAAGLAAVLETACSTRLSNTLCASSCLLARSREAASTRSRSHHLNSFGSASSSRASSSSRERRRVKVRGSQSGGRATSGA